MQAFGTFLIALLATASLASFAQSPDPGMAAIRADQDYNTAMVNDLLAEGTPRAMVLAATALPYARPEHQAQAAKRSELLSRAARLAPDDAFVQWFAALYAKPESVLSEPAQTLMRLEPDNGAAWLFMLQAASEANNQGAATDALARIGAAAIFDEHFAEFTLEWMARFSANPRTAEPAQGPEQALSQKPLIMALARSNALAMPAFAGLISACIVRNGPSPPGRREACIAAGGVIAAHSTTVLSRGMGVTVLRNSGAPDYATSARDFTYLRQNYSALSTNLACDPAEFDHFQSDWVETRSQIQVAKSMLLRAGLPVLPPAEWEPDPNEYSPVGKTRGCG